MTIADPGNTGNVGTAGIVSSAFDQRLCPVNGIRQLSDAFAHQIRRRFVR
jgi:hypothetical protein